MDAEKFALTVLMALVIAIVIRLSLAVARRFKIKHEEERAWVEVARRELSV